MSERDIFIGAMQRDGPAERGAYLEDACGADAALRRRVEGLLEVYDRAGSFLEEPAAPPTDTGAYTSPGPEARTAAPGQEAGAMIAGRYKLLEVVGEGGMGTVWLAEQTEPVRRKVALKVIKAGMDSRQVVARFEAERQALALMDHPNIAKVLDGGGTADGRPYFVMDLVKGVPITRYCDEHHLSPRQRLELFADVCRAVQHAHQKGVIHRDIKPSNVMVAPYDGRPVVKVIDFGVSKAVGQPLTEKTLFTGLGAVVGTPEYMSPEQAELNNADVDTRSDVYSLGVLLYELLTGTTPLTRARVKEVGLLEVLRVIREEEPPKPSTRLSTTDELSEIAANRGLEPRKLGGVVRGELDWIVMKCLEKDRNRRYETASAFAADVERYLHDEPVQACPPSAWYRFCKFARRNRRAVATVGLLGVVLLAAVVGLTISNRRLDQERAQTEAANARLNANLWLAMQTLNEVYGKVGEWAPRDPRRRQEYLELLEKLLTFYEQFAGQDGAELQVRVNLAHYHLQFANVLQVGGDRDKAIEHYRRALDVRTQVNAESPNVDAHQDQLASLTFHLADSLHQAGQTAEAAEYYRRGFQIVEEKVSESARLYGGRGSLVAEYSRALAWHLATCPEPRFRDPARAVQVGQKAAAWTAVGIAHYRAGKMTEAVTALEKATAHDSDSTAYLFLAMAHCRRGDKDKARQWYDRAIRETPSATTGFPVRYEAFRAEAATLLGVDGDRKERGGASAPGKP